MEPKIMRLDKLYLAGVCVFGNADKGLFSHAWDIFLKINVGINWKNDRKTYGVEFFTEEYHREKKWFYMVAMELADLSEIPINMVGKVIPANTYAVFTAKGGVKNLPKTSRYAHDEWLPKSKYEEADWFEFELYDERFKDIDDPASEIDIYIPIREKDK